MKKVKKRISMLICFFLLTFTIFIIKTFFTSTDRLFCNKKVEANLSEKNNYQSSYRFTAIFPGYYYDCEEIDANFDHRISMNASIDHFFEKYSSLDMNRENFCDWTYGGYHNEENQTHKMTIGLHMGETCNIVVYKNKTGGQEDYVIRLKRHTCTDYIPSCIVHNIKNQIEYICLGCQKENTATISASLSQLEFKYNGKIQQPKIVVKRTMISGANREQLLSREFYTVQMPDSKEVGDYRVIVKFKGDVYKYLESQTLTYSIVP
ncbi:MAG: hypothetical protein Q4D45_10785 [Lachnospiraceae bacterium]|nr:hypothetical protein [Lachnospiraceae bacterium]